MAPTFDLSVYLVTDPVLTGGRSVEATVAAALAGGVTLVQLRDPHAKGRAMVETARRLLAILKPAGIPLIINDRIDVALAVDADGVHVGQSDIDARDVRALIGPDKILGLSIGTPAEFEASRAALGVVDYVGAGAVFATQTKTEGVAAIGLAGVTAMRRLVDKPIVAIGGLAAANAGAAIAAGADGVAVVSAVMNAADPAGAAAAIAREVGKAREART
jgi:thiamine-phosphate pyrophosphorylase